MERVGAEGASAGMMEPLAAVEEDDEEELKEVEGAAAAAGLT